MKQPNLSLPPAVVTPKDTQAPPFTQRKCFRCPCSISYCQSGKIRNVLEATGLNNLRGARRVEYVGAPASHQQRKLYALRKCVKFHLKIADKVIHEKRHYGIPAYHWPISTLEWRRRACSMLNHIEAKILDNKHPPGSFPLSKLFLHNSNNYGRLITCILDPLLVLGPW